MTTRTGIPAATPPAPRGQAARPWLALVFVSLAQLATALDATIVNVALPSAQRALNFPPADRQEVITAYTAAFAGLLLLGGRVADRLGHRVAFTGGLAGFAAASALGGAAVDLPMLTIARALQGACAALLAPTVLSLIASTFTEPRERGKAFAVFGAIAGSGGAVGLVLGGVLTEYLSWRWCLYVNLPVVAIAAIGLRWLPSTPPGGQRARIDVLGAALATAGLGTAAYASARAATTGWSSGPIIGLLAEAAAALILFGYRQTRVSEPLLPLRILADRNHAGAYLAVATAVAGMLGVFLILSYYLQTALGYRPLAAGAAFLPLSAAVIATSQLTSRLLRRLPPGPLIVSGLLTAAIGMALLTRLSVTSDYAGVVLPAELVLGAGMGTVFVPAFSTATTAIPPRDTGIASAVVTVAQQAGATVGVAVLSTVAASTTATHQFSSAFSSVALVHGYTTAAAVAAGFLTAGALAAALLIRTPHPGKTQP